MTKHLEVALAYTRAGLCVLPANLADKRPDAGNWKQYQNRLPTDDELRRWFKRDRPMCLVAGPASNNLEMIDFDCGGEKFAWWKQLVELKAPGLVDTLVLERSPSGGWHVVYRHQSEVFGNLKLAERAAIVPGAEEVTLYGKKYKPRKVDDRWEVWLTLIETRGEGGIFLCDPTPGYKLVQGNFESLPVLTEEQRFTLLDAAWSLNELQRRPEPTTLPATTCEPNGRPGDDFNERGDVRAVLLKHGWTLAKGGENEYWRRPGKTGGTSATLKDGIFYVFSSNAAPFEPGRAYKPFGVFTLLEHNGDHSAAASSLRAEGFGDSHFAPAIQISRFASPDDIAPPKNECTDPGPIPNSLLHVPGFVSEVMDHCLETAPYPNLALAFCGALALQALLAGRKVRDAGDNRTNIYLLALAYSSVGKDWPRKVNTHILHQVGLIKALGEKFASGEGIQDLLFHTPAMVFQTDEIDGLLQSINKSRDARHEGLMGTLLTMYSTANSIYPMRCKAGKESLGVIDQPCLVVYGTAIPTHYYEALSERMLTNGFFARMLIVESGPRSAGQEPGIIDPPASVMDTARWWVDFNPGEGNLETWHPRPRTVEANDDARDLLAEARITSETEYANAEARGDPVGTTVWGRVPEHIRKLSLLYAVSVNYKSPRISTDAVHWATDFMMHQTRRMLFMAGNHVAENPFHAECLKLLRKLREAPGRELAHSVLLKRMKTDAKTFQELVTTLEQQGDVVTVLEATAGRPQRHYRLLGETNVEA